MESYPQERTVIPDMGLSGIAFQGWEDNSHNCTTDLHETANGDFVIYTFL